MKRIKVSPYMAGIIVALFFGISFLMTQTGLRQMPAMVLLSYRFGIAALFMTAMRLCNIIHIDYKDKPMKGIIALSVFYPGISFCFETVALYYVPSSQAGIVVSISPIFVTIFALLILRETPKTIQVFFVLLSVTGVFITTVFARGSDDEGMFFGILLMLVSVAAGALNNVLSRKYSKYFTSVEITYMMICLGAVIFTGISLIQGVFERNVFLSYKVPFQSLEILLVMLGLSIGTSVIAFFCLNYMLSKLKAANVSVFMNLATVISIAAGVLVAKERLHWYQVTGGVIIIISVWGTSYYENKK